MFGCQRAEYMRGRFVRLYDDRAICRARQGQMSHSTVEKWGCVSVPSFREIGKTEAVGGGENPHFSQRTREMGHPDFVVAKVTNVQFSSARVGKSSTATAAS